MALVTEIERTTKERQSLHGATECTASILDHVDGRRYLQLDTFGRSDRQMPGKVSQSLQFDEGAARQMIALLEEAFPQLRRR